MSSITIFQIINILSGLGAIIVLILFLKSVKDGAIAMLEQRDASTSVEANPFTSQEHE